MKDNVRKRLSDQREIAGIGPTFCATQAPPDADKSRGWPQGAPSSCAQPQPISDSGNQLPAERKTIGRPDRETTRRSPGGVALSFVSRLGLPAIVIAMMAAPIAATDTPAMTPLGCGITWTRTGGVWIYEPDCSHQSPPSQPSPNAPPPNPGTPPNPPPTP